jgi:hypothetical protein
LNTRPTRGGSAEAGLFYKKFGWNGELIQRKNVFKMGASLAGSATLRAGVSAGYSRKFEPNDPIDNKLWIQFDGLQIFLNGEASVEFGPHKGVARTSYTAYATNAYSSFLPWKSGISN